MRNLTFAAAVLIVVPGLRAQQTDTNKNQAVPQAIQQEATENSRASDVLPAAIRPGHPLDPTDVDVLTGKKDREVEEPRSAVFYYGGYADFFATNGWRDARYDFPLLPLTRIRNPFLFSIIQPRGLARGGFRGRR